MEDAGDAVLESGDARERAVGPSLHVTADLHAKHVAIERQRAIHVPDP